MYAKVALQILGSGGPEFSDRASSSYLVFVDNKAKVLVDMGAGSFKNFSKSGAKIEDLRVIALTHLHIDHSANLVPFMKGGYFSPRKDTLPILGPTGNKYFPDIKTFVQRLFGINGAYSYMKDILTTHSSSFRLKPIVLSKNRQTLNFGDINITSTKVNHAIVPALAYSIEVEGKKIVFSGDTSAKSDNLIKLAKNADYLVAHHAITQNAGKIAKKLHMTPLRIGEIAKKANVKNLVLSHRMLRTYGHEKQSEKLIRQNYKGNIIWAEDMMKIKI